MTLPNWFRVVWWLALLATLSAFLLHRYPTLQAGQAVPADVFVFAVWIALALAPLFKEMSFLGVRLKQDVAALRDQVEGLRADIQNSVNVSAQISPQFNFPPPPPSDARLHELAPMIRSEIDTALRRYGLTPGAAGPSPVDVPDDTVFLFRVRHNLERELRRIWIQRFQGDERRRPVPINHIINTLTSSELLPPRLTAAIRDVYAVCSPAIHGQPVSQAQVDFVREVGGQLIVALQAIE